MKPYVVTAVFGDLNTPGGYLALGTFAAERPEIASAHVVDRVIRDLHPSEPLAGVTIMELTEELLRGMLALYDESMPTAKMGPDGKASIVSIVPSRPPPIHPNEQAARDADDRNRGLMPPGWPPLGT